jgi:hypothetical protein
MQNRLKILMGLCIALIFGKVKAQDTLLFKGQFSAYTHLNSENCLPWWNGGRYIPQINYKYNLLNNNLLDFEASANLYGTAGLQLFDSTSCNGDIKPYRLWTRYSSNQFELRTGLQKINFGSATLLRPLMWFDQIDPRDPLKLTDGVWGVLIRYYLLNNANIWLWGLYGNENLKGWETIKSKKNIPEFGGRFQTPVPKGETGFSYHYRVADGSMLSNSPATPGTISENRFGFDAKFDMIVGWWVEASWSNFNDNIGSFRNQEIINLGLDYTFAVGNGLTAIYEQLIASSGEKAFAFNNPVTFSLLSFTYPIGLFDNISAIIYYDWTNHKSYNFLNWQRRFNRITLHIMGYVNPKDYYIPAQGSSKMLYAGNGLQVMFVLNH